MNNKEYIDKIELILNTSGKYITRKEKDMIIDYVNYFKSKNNVIEDKNIELVIETERLNKENKELKDDLEEYKQIGIKQFSRPYAKRYLEELKKEIPNLLYPDSEKIYEDYYDLRDRIEIANNFIDQEIMYLVKPKDYNKIEMLQDILNDNDFAKGSDKE